MERLLYVMHALFKSKMYSQNAKDTLAEFCTNLKIDVLLLRSCAERGRHALHLTIVGKNDVDVNRVADFLVEDKGRLHLKNK
jgi:hypothetical protein